MKRNAFIIIICVLIFASCSVEQNNSLDVRTFIDSRYLKDTAPYVPVDDGQETIMDPPVESKIKLGNKEIVADLTSVKSYTSRSQQQVYCSKDGNMNYVLYSEHPSFNIYIPDRFSKNAVLSYFEGEGLSEQALVSYAKEYMSLYFDINILSNYNYSFTTAVLISKGIGTWMEEKEGFYTPENNCEFDVPYDETVRGYRITYTEYCGPIATADTINIMFDENGNITYFEFMEYNVNWQGVNFEEENVIEAVEIFLNEYISEEFELVDYNIRTRRLVYSEGKIQLALNLDLTLKNSEQTFETACDLRLSD